MSKPTSHKLRGLRCLVIVPAFNERHAIAELVHRLKRALPEFDIVVIDDGSTDDTARRIPESAAVISLPFNLGIGGAMQTGYRYAAMHNYDIAVQVDGDGQHRPAEVLRLVEHLVDNRLDLAIGSRFLEPTRYRQTVVRRAGAWFLHLVLRALAGIRMTDCTSGFRAANRRAISAFAHWYPEDYPEPEVVLLLHRAGFNIAELPVRMRQRRGGTSSISLVAGLFYVIKVTTCLVLDLVREPWPSLKVAVEDRVAPDDAPPHPAAAPLTVAGQLRAALSGHAHEHQPHTDPAGAGWQPAAAGRQTPANL